MFIKFGATSVSPGKHIFLVDSITARLCSCCDVIFVFNHATVIYIYIYSIKYEYHILMSRRFTWPRHDLYIISIHIAAFYEITSPLVENYKLSNHKYCLNTSRLLSIHSYCRVIVFYHPTNIIFPFTLSPQMLQLHSNWGVLFDQVRHKWYRPTCLVVSTIGVALSLRHFS